MARTSLFGVALLILSSAASAQGSTGYNDELDSGSYEVDSPSHPNIDGASVTVPFNDPNTPGDESEDLTVKLGNISNVFSWDPNRNGYVSNNVEWKIIYYDATTGDFEVRHYDDPTTPDVNEGDDLDTPEVEEDEHVHYEGALKKK